MVVAVKNTCKKGFNSWEGENPFQSEKSFTFHKIGFEIPTLFDVSHLMNKVMNF